MTPDLNPRQTTYTRRRFLQRSLAGGAYATAAIITGCRAGRDFDLVIANGSIYDGLGGPPLTADLGIKNRKIAAIGNLSGLSATRSIDANGLAIAPGFIDMHAHSDDDLLVDGRAHSKIRQGVTTEVLGQDGGSMAPLNAVMREKMDESFRKRYNLSIDWQEFRGYFKRLRKKGLSVNVTSMVGAGTLREYVIGMEDRPATEKELDDMKALLQKCLEQGARHLSTGLEYTPGSFANTEELAALAAVLGPKGLYATHMRNEDDTVLQAVAEAEQIARTAGVRLHISHLKVSGQRNWHKLPALFAYLEEARSTGLHISSDRYPYVAYSTGLTSLFPLWCREGGNEAFVSRLQDESLQPRIRAGVEGKVAMLGSWDAVMISSLQLPEHKAYEGKRLGELAQELNTEPFALLRDLLIDENGRGGMVGFAMSEENTEKILSDPHNVVASDGSALAVEGPLASGSPHPRNFGTFPRVLGYYVRERKIMPLETAIHKMTAQPAQIVGIRDRGRLAENMWADVVIFDPLSVRDTATFSQPKQYPEGIEYVVVNGVVVIDGGEHTNARPGVVL